jgi:DNA helicase-2/ATP-dependent DNA helicase PcrA
MARIENVQELLNSIKDFSDVNGNGNPVTLDKFLENVALLTDADTDKDEDREKVSMMTIHSSKGLEFDYVYLGGVEEDLFPSKMVLTSPQDLEEERRLFYVAITRAGKEAVISYASHRYKWGQPAICTPSRFIKDIDEKYLQLPSDMGDIEIEEEEPYDYDAPTFVQKTKPQGAYSSQSRQIERKPVIKKQPLPTVAPPMMKSSLIKMNRAEHRQPTMNDTFETDDPMQIKVGMRVLHVQFGLGVVSDIEGVMPNAKATVDFEGAGQRKLLLKFARLKIVG